MIICESMDATEGWAYIHLTNPASHNWHEDDPIIEGEQISEIYREAIDHTPHLHFQRSYPQWTAESGAPTGLYNPLDFLIPAIQPEYWVFIPQPEPPEHPWCYFLEDQTIDDWEAWEDLEDFYADTLASDELQGSIDIIQGISMITTGEVGTQLATYDVLAPYRIEWDCVRRGNTVDADEVIFNRHLVSFEGEIGSLDDWVKYRQFYFRFDSNDLFPENNASEIVCLTNCAESEFWDGINNIEENCWNTVESLDGSGDSYHPLNMRTPDGLYRVDVTAFAWDTTVSQDVSIECTVISVLPERMPGISPNTDERIDESVRTPEAASAVESSLMIEVAGSDGEYSQFGNESRNNTGAVRYVRVRGACGISEISVYGQRESSVIEAASIEVRRNTENGSWVFALPEAENGEDTFVKIYDVSGRMIWSGVYDSGDEVHWDGHTDNGEVVPGGVYLLQCDIGGEVFTGKLLVVGER